MLACTWADPVFLHFRCNRAAPALPAPLSMRSIGGASFVTVRCHRTERLRLGLTVPAQFGELALYAHVDGPSGPGGYFLETAADTFLGANAAMLWGRRGTTVQMRLRHWGPDHRVEIRQRGAQRLAGLLREISAPATPEPETEAGELLHLERFYAGREGALRSVALKTGALHVAPCDAVELGAPWIESLVPGAQLALAQAGQRIDVKLALPVRVKN